MRARLQRLQPDQALARWAPNTMPGADQPGSRTAIDTPRPPLAVAIAALTLATAAIHLVYAFPTPMFIAAGTGYLLLLAAFFMPRLRSVRGVVGAALALFALGNMVAWYFIGARVPLAYADKLVEAGLVLALTVYLVQLRRRGTSPVRLSPS
jgi:hypothetical protein